MEGKRDRSSMYVKDEDGILLRGDDSFANDGSGG